MKISFGIETPVKFSLRIDKEVSPPPPYMPTADVDYIYKIVNEEVHIIRYIGDEVKITVPSEIEGYPVTKLYSTAFNYSTVEKVKLPDSLVSIE